MSLNLLSVKPFIQPAVLFACHSFRMQCVTFVSRNCLCMHGLLSSAFCCGCSDGRMIVSDAIGAEQNTKCISGLFMRCCTLSVPARHSDVGATCTGAHGIGATTAWWQPVMLISCRNVFLVLQLAVDAGRSVVLLQGHDCTVMALLWFLMLLRPAFAVDQVDLGPMHAC